MLNASSLNAVNGAKFSQRFVKPLYDSYCFANLPQAIEYMLTGEGHSALPQDVFTNLPSRYNKVILFFVDAFGWRFFERYAEKYEFLKTVLKHGVVSKMTSQFPSTTAAHVTCIHTGLNVGQSGVYEWNYYEPLVDEVIAPLLFSYAGDKERDTLKHAGIAAEAYFPRQTVYQRLHTMGIASYALQSEAYTQSTFSTIVYKGAQLIPYRRWSEALMNLEELVFSDRAQVAYYFLYFDKIDATGHTYGPNSDQFERMMDTFMLMMEEFYQKLAGKLEHTLLVMTADHGQLEVDPQKTFYLNRQAAGIEQYLQTNRHGRPIVPAGSARDMFLHIKEERVDEAIAFLQKHLENKAEVYRTQQLVGQHFFGPAQPSNEFMSRVGNVVILPYQDETVWWYEGGRFEMHFRGHHGGLMPQEMEIPLLLLPL
jgi:Type I phosphodiesterase / nucleotide pyrophosphatase